MKTSTKVFLCISLIMLLAGGGLVYSALYHAGFDWDKLTINVQNETFDYAVTDAVREVHIETKQADVRVVQAFDNACSVRAKAASRDSCFVETEDGVLTVICMDDPSVPWYKRIWRQDDTTVTVFLPQAVFLQEKAYENLSVESGSGDVYVSDALTFKGAHVKSGSGDMEFYAPVSGDLSVTSSSGDLAVKRVNCQDLTVSSGSGVIACESCRCDSLAVSSTSGDVSLTACTTKNMKADTASGEISFTRIAVSEHLNVTSSSGDITYNDSTASSIQIVAKSGDVTGVLQEPMLFDVRSDSGDITVPASDGTSRCSIRTGSGDIAFVLTGDVAEGE